MFWLASSVHADIVGTGASAIFSLLAAKINGWSMLATEVDTVSISFAKANVTKNVLEEIVTGMSKKISS